MWTKLAALTLLALAVWLQPSASEVFPPFAPGKEYKFQYEAQVLTGIPVGEEVYSGLRIKADVITQIHTGFQVTLKLDNIFAYKLLKPVGELTDTVELLPVHLFELLPERYAEHLKIHLIKPIKFRYEAGLVTKLTTLTEDPLWSVNLKKGLLNLFQLKLIPEYHKEKAGGGWSVDDIKPVHQYNKVIPPVFTNMETDFAGKCKSLYEITPTEVEGHMDGWKINKVRNYDRCIKKSWAVSGIISTDLCEDTKTELVKPYTFATYILGGTLKSFIIKKAVLSGKFLFAPMYGKLGNSGSYYRQELILKEVKNVINLYELTGAVRHHPELLEVMIPEGDAALYLTSTFLENKFTDTIMDKKINKVKELLTYLWKIITEEKKHEIFITTKNLLEFLAELDLTTLNKIKELYFLPVKTTDETIKIRELLLDLLPSVGSPESTKVLLDLVKTNKLTGHKAALAINLATMTTKPYLALIKETLVIYQTIAATVDYQVKQALLLGAGVLMNKLYKELAMQSESNTPTTVLPTAYSEDVVGIIKDIFLKAATDEDKLLIVKAIGNAGWVDLLPVLRAMFENVHVAAELRTKALYALRRIAPLHCNKMHPVLLPIFLNPSESVDVRIAAFVIIMSSNPGVGKLHLIVHRLKNEPNTQVASFVYSYLKSLSTSTLPCHRVIASLVRYLIIINKPMKMNFMSSKGFMWHKYYEPFGLGAGMDFAFIKRPETILPMFIYGQIHSQIFGAHSHPAEIGVDIKGLDMLVTRLFGPEGILHKNNINIADLLKPGRLNSLKAMKDEILNILRVIELELPKLKDPKLAMYVKLFGNQLRTFTLDKVFIEKLLKGDVSYFLNYPAVLEMLEKGYKLDLLKLYHLKLAKVTTVTPVGLPLSLALDATPFMKAVGDVKVQTSPPLKEALSVFKVPQIWNVDMDIKSSFLVDTMAHMQVHLGPVSVGAAYHMHGCGSVPIKVKAVVDMKNTKLNTEIELPVVETELLHMKFEPISFLKYYPLPNTVDEILTYGIVMKDAKNTKVTPITLAVGKDYINMDVILKMTISDNPLLPWLGKYLLAGKQELNIAIKPYINKPKIVFEGILEHPFNLPSIILPATSPVTIRMDREQSHWWSFMAGAKETKTAKEILDNMEIIKFSEAHFDPVIVNPIIKEAKKIKFGWLMKLVTSETPIKIGSQATWFYSAHMLYHQIDWQMYRTAIPVFDINAMKIKIDGFVNLPGFFLKPKAEILAADLLFKQNWNLFWGKPGALQKRVGVKMLNLPLVSPSAAEITTFYKNIKPETWNILKHFLKYKTEIEYMEVPVFWKKFAVMVHQYLKYYFFHYMNVDVIGYVPQPNKISTVLQIHPIKQKVEWNINTPIEKNMIFIPFGPLIAYIPSRFINWLPKLNIHPTLPYMEHIKSVIIQENAFNGLCTVKGTDVETFDEVKYKLPITECTMMVAQDCSPDHLFSILMNQYPAPHYYKELVIFLPGKKLVIKPDAAGKATIWMNNEQLQITETTVIKEHIHASHSPVAVKMVLVNEFLVVSLPKYSLTIATNMKEVRVQVGPVVHGKVCGLCGNFDGEAKGEFKDPKQYILPHPEKFAVSWLVPSAKCDMEKIKKIKARYEVPVSVGVKKVMNYVLKRVAGNGKNEVCFSLYPVTTCAMGYKAADYIKTYAGFYCLPEEHPTVASLMAMREKGPLTGIQFMYPSMYQYIHVPSRCVRNV
uniref:Vitellogenin n=1 Tax=Sipunculus nudus TaxID=6446 RepID=A0A8U0ASD8_SIPNU|nr:vitellogenin [Sipunculus nudus]